MLKILRYLWQLPQNILGLCLEGLLCNTCIRGNKLEGNRIIWCDILFAPVSLGDYIFLTSNSTKESIEHECGHSKQSTKLGPLYLIIIGIPSLLHNIVYYLCSKIGIKWDYYKFYTEHWLM